MGINNRKAYEVTCTNMCKKSTQLPKTIKTISYLTMPTKFLRLMGNAICQ